MAAKPPTADRITARARSDRAFLKRALNNPGLRSKLAPDLLPAAQRQQRQLNQRLNAPITPGSSTTERDLAREAQAATSVKYGPQERDLQQNLGVSQTTERDTGSFYDQYVAQLAQHSQNVQAYQAGAQQALAATAQGITGLSGQQGAQLQQQANQAAAPLGAQAGDLSGMASNATAVRQALIGSFQAQQAGQGAAANTYADTQARVVAPGQKLAAQAQARGRTADVRKQITGLKAEQGAYNQQYRAQRRADEFKNVLAAQTLAGNQAVAGAKAAASTPEGQAAAATARTTATEEAKNAAKLGLSVHGYRMLGPTERRRRLDSLKATRAGSASDTRYTSGPFAGMLKSEVNALSPKAAQQKVDDYSKGRKGKPGAGPDWKTSEATSRGMSQLTSLKGYAAKAKRGEAFVAGHAGQAPVDRRGAAQKIQGAVAAPDDPILVTAALDAVYDGHLSPATVRRLIAAGYKPSRVAQTLGVPTAGARRPARGAAGYGKGSQPG